MRPLLACACACVRRYAFRAWKRGVKLIKHERMKDAYADYYANRLLVNRVFTAWGKFAK